MTRQPGLRPGVPHRRSATRAGRAAQHAVVINAVFNFRNFWDGRATYHLQRREPLWRLQTPTLPQHATWNRSTATTRHGTSGALNNASLASLATGPPLSDLEMSAAGRTFPQLAARSASAAAALRWASRWRPTTACWPAVRHSTGDGLNRPLPDMVQGRLQARVVERHANVSVGGKSYTQIEANFSLFFGLACSSTRPRWCPTRRRSTATWPATARPCRRSGVGHGGVLRQGQVHQLPRRRRVHQCQHPRKSSPPSP
jgi:hypothetical protein